MKKKDIEILINNVSLEDVKEVPVCCITNDSYKEKEKEV